MILIIKIPRCLSTYFFSLIKLILEFLELILILSKKFTHINQLEKVALVKKNSKVKMWWLIAGLNQSVRTQYSVMAHFDLSYPLTHFT